MIHRHGDGRERGADLVGDPRSDLPGRGEPLRRQELALEPLAVGDVPEDGRKTEQPAGVVEDRRAGQLHFDHPPVPRPAPRLVASDGALGGRGAVDPLQLAARQLLLWHEH
jgi:hypothetical protein